MSITSRERTVSSSVTWAAALALLALGHCETLTSAAATLAAPVADIAGDRVQPGTASEVYQRMRQAVPALLDSYADVASLFADREATDDNILPSRGTFGHGGGMPRPAAFQPHPDRLFPADPGTRALAREIYEGVRDLPIISLHGHVDARVLLEAGPFRDPSGLLITPDH